MSGYRDEYTSAQARNAAMSSVVSIEGRESPHFSSARLLSIGLTSFLAGNLAFFLLPETAYAWLFGALIVASATVVSGRWRRVVMLAGGACLAAWLLTARTAAFWEALPERAEYSGNATLIHIAERSTFFQSLVLRPNTCDAGVSSCSHTDILVRAPLTFESEEGAAWHLRCTLERPKNFDAKFDYRHYLLAQGIGFVCEHPLALEPLSDPPVSWRSALDRVRHAATTLIRTALPEPQAGLALGLVLGGNDYLSRETKDMFAAVGLSHIVAVSGYNMTLVVQCILFGGLLLGLWRRGALVLALICVGAFLLLIGAPASAMRAALMTLAAFGAYLVGRLPASFNALLLSAGIMVITQPFIARYDVGFQLSFFATLALLVSSPWVERSLFLQTLWGKGLAPLVFTVIIELLTAPVLLATFGQVAWIAPLTNLVVLPFVTLATLTLIGFLLGASLVPPLTALFAIPLWLVLTCIVESVRFFATLPFGQYHAEALPSWIAVSWYALLALLGLLSSRLYTSYVLSLER